MFFAGNLRNSKLQRKYSTTEGGGNGNTGIPACCYLTVTGAREKKKN